MNKSFIKTYAQAFLDLVFPNICLHCKSPLSGNEQQVCSLCLSKLPFTNNWQHQHNVVSEVFWGRVRVEGACSMVFFEKDSIFQGLLHHLKYKDNPQVGVVLGRYFANKLAGSKFANADVVVPVPLHKYRFRKRGYNQSERIAVGIHEVLNIPVLPDNMKRIKATKTQTSKSRFERWQNVEGVFKIDDPEVFVDKHVLVVDDVVTTGATSESLMAEILKIPGTRVSFVALASA